MRVPFVGPIAVLGLFQIIIWFGTFLLVATILSLGEKVGVPTRFFPDGVIWMRSWGLSLLFLPSLWMLWASWDAEANRSSFLSLKEHLAIGGLLLAATSLTAPQFVGKAWELLNNGHL